MTQYPPRDISGPPPTRKKDLGTNSQLFLTPWIHRCSPEPFDGDFDSSNQLLQRRKRGQETVDKGDLLLPSPPQKIVSSPAVSDWPWRQFVADGSPFHIFPAMYYNSFKPLVKGFLDGGRTINHLPFRLYFVFSIVFFFSCSIVVTLRQQFGDPIDCMTRDAINSKVLDNFCWTQGTFSLANAFNKTMGIEVPYPGIDKYTPGEVRIYHHYYQWVCFYLFFLGCAFYATGYLWKNFEGGLVNALVGNLEKHTLTDAQRQEGAKRIADYYRMHAGDHKIYAAKFIFCEILNFIVSILLVALTDKFLNYEFSDYGLKMLLVPYKDHPFRHDPMIQIFPRLAKCTFHRYGASGDVQRHDSMCTLPLNIINEKIFLAAWFWMMFMVIISGICIIYRTGMLAIRGWRRALLIRAAYRAEPALLDVVLENFDYGDWFLLSLLRKNIDQYNFREVIRQLAPLYNTKVLKEDPTCPYCQDVDQTMDNCSDEKEEGGAVTSSLKTWAQLAMLIVPCQDSRDTGCTPC
ncbi:Inx2 [Cordylochernes scorpioides]|uniref:Innexin n=1 Tax=Cordylochernes scorpioides TaxID=51811 RepID=A0ABY6K7S7_9ARAC|nr:Inx2 [Cordylochernes scorpioides]